MFSVTCSDFHVGPIRPHPCLRLASIRAIPSPFAELFLPSVARDNLPGTARTGKVHPQPGSSQANRHSAAACWGPS
jgi:hypothetical protein